MDALRIAAIVAGIVALMLWIAWARRSDSRLYAVPILLWLVNDLAFLIVRQAGYANLPLLNAWSLALHLQASLTLVGIGFYAWRKRLEPRAGC